MWAFPLSILLAKEKRPFIPNDPVIALSSHLLPLLKLRTLYTSIFVYANHCS